MELIKIVKDNEAYFDFYRSGFAYYKINVEGKLYSFPVEVKDLCGATIHSTQKAITLMRYIRRALDNKTFLLQYGEYNGK